ncbi:MAG: FtsX-like permease family protein [Ruminococcaceae bacterium]|nr:FtsX-like permease family protein [Oscillospiraceae bacterium]
MLKFTLKNMMTKKVKIFLIVLSIIISSSVGILAYNIAEQVRSGIVNTAAYYDIIIGPAGSSTQLAMNTMFFTDTPLGTISYEYVEELEADDRTNTVIPFAMGDSYNSARIIGTKPAFLEGKELAEGEMFHETFDAVVGSAVAKTYGISVGDKLVTSHGLSESGSSHESTPLTVTGILETTKTAYDNAVFTDIETVWSVHDHEEDEHEEHDEEHNDEHAEDTSENEAPSHGHIITDSSEEKNEEEEHTHESGTVCAILVKSKSFSDYYEITEEYGKDSSLLVINPSTVLREVLDNVDLSKQIVYILCIIILIMNVFVISTITLLNMYDSQKEIALMRLIGISTGKVNLMFLIQNAIIGLASTALAFGASRLCIMLISKFVSSMGIVLDARAVYPLEWVIMAVVFIISVLPTLICTAHISKKDIIRN